MTQVFDYLTHFTADENWGDATQVSGVILLLLDAVRTAFDAPFVVHCAYEQSGHTPASQHYQGNAVDFHCVTPETFPVQVCRLGGILDNLQIDHACGLGIYPDWHNPGFHLDCRGKRARWGRIADDYVSFAEALDYARTKAYEKWKRRIL